MTNVLENDSGLFSLNKMALRHIRNIIIFPINPLFFDSKRKLWIVHITGRLGVPGSSWTRRIITELHILTISRVYFYLCKFQVNMST